MMSIDYRSVLEEIGEKILPLVEQGRVADYIPALGKVSAEKFGMAVRLIDGQEFTLADADEKFSIQSISKLFSLTLALKFAKGNLWERVGREPSGSPFNSLVQLEYEAGIPRNPFINAGALVVIDALTSRFKKADDRLLEFVRRLSGNSQLSVDEEVFRSEVSYGDLNRSIAYFLKAHGTLENTVEVVTRAYFRQCALSMTCTDLARAVSFLANHGVSMDGDAVLSERQAKRVNALMLTCGLYDGVGEFAFRVGIPGKSGVGGGIVAIIPGLLSVGVWSPGLDEQGNSVAGVKAMELFTSYLGRSVF